MGFFSKLFDPSAGEIKRLNKIVDKIDSFEEAHKALTDEQLRGKTDRVPRAACKTAKPRMTFCPKRSPPSAKPTPACWECASTVCR